MNNVLLVVDVQNNVSADNPKYTTVCDYVRKHTHDYDRIILTGHESPDDHDSVGKLDVYKDLRYIANVHVWSLSKNNLALRNMVEDYENITVIGCCDTGRLVDFGCEMRDLSMNFKILTDYVYTSEWPCGNDRLPELLSLMFDSKYLVTGEVL